jgi:hypothetical protein
LGRSAQMKQPQSQCGIAALRPSKWLHQRFCARQPWGGEYRLVLHRRLTTQSRGRLARTRKPPLTSNVRQRELKADFMPHLPLPAARCLSLDASCPWERRAHFSVGLGCPSFGGQRTLRSRSGRLLASLGTCRRSSLFAKRPRRLPAHSIVGSVARVSALSRSPRLAGRRQKQYCKGWPNFEYQMPEVSTRHGRASGHSTQSLPAVAASRSGRPLAQPGSPNHSVKGTSRKRAAPYVER